MLSMAIRHVVDLNPVARHALSYEGTPSLRNPKLVGHKRNTHETGGISPIAINKEGPEKGPCLFGGDRWT